jgi:hypothetical protein
MPSELRDAMLILMHISQLHISFILVTGLYDTYIIKKATYYYCTHCWYAQLAKLAWRLSRHVSRPPFTAWPQCRHTKFTTLRTAHLRLIFRFIEYAD